MKKRIPTEKGYVMVEFSNTYGCFIWTCEWGHMGFDFEGSEEARQDFLKHDCKRSI